MKEKIISLLFGLGFCGIILVVYRSIPQTPHSIAQAQSAEQTLSNSIPCYPKKYSPPVLTKKSAVGTKEYTYVLAIPTYLKDSSRNVEELIFERDIVKKSCKQHNFGVDPFTDFLPEKVAIDFKEQRWRRTWQEMGTKKFKDLLNTPPEIPEPFYLYDEDVQAIARLGFKPGPKTKVIKSQSELDYLYDLHR